MSDRDPRHDKFCPPEATVLRNGETKVNYQLESCLGSGSFGVVHAARQLGEPIAAAWSPDQSQGLVIKVLRGKLGHDKDTFDAEVANLERVSKAPVGTRVIRLVDSFVDQAHGNCYCIVTAPLCQGGNLESVLSQKEGRPAYDLPTALRWALEVAESLHVLHTSSDIRLYHGDISPRNVFLFNTGSQLEAYVGDLGIAIHNHPYGLDEADAMMHYSAWAAPEIRDKTEFGENADVWSLGVLLWSLLSRAMPEDHWPDFEMAWAFFLQVGASPSGAQALAGQLSSQWQTEIPVQVLELLASCLRPQASRASMRRVVFELRKALGRHQGAGGGGVMPSLEGQVLELEDQLAALKAGQSPVDSVAVSRLLLQVAKRHFILQEYRLNEERLRQAIDLLRSEALPLSSEGELELANGLSALSNQMLKKGDCNEGLQLAEEAQAIRESLLPPSHPEVAASLVATGWAHEYGGRFEVARRYYEQAVAKYKESSAGQAAGGLDSPVRRGLAKSIRHLAGLCNTVGEYEDAMTLHMTALRLWGWHHDGSVQEPAVAVASLEDQMEVATSLANLAEVHYNKKDHGGALLLLDKALALRREALPPDHEDTACVFNDMAANWAAEGDHHKSLELHIQAMDMRERSLPRGHSYLAVNYNNIGMQYRALNQHDQAAEWLGKALAIWRQTLSPDHPDIAAGCNNLAMTYHAIGRLADAVPLLQEAVRIMEQAKPQHPTTMQMRRNLAALRDAETKA